MTNSIAISDADISEMTEEAVNAIALIVQKAVGQTDGGLAGQHFGEHGGPREAIREIIVEYLRIEELHCVIEIPQNPRVKVFEVETFADAPSKETLQVECDLNECLDEDDAQIIEARQALHNMGEYWTGGGAAPLVVLRRVP